MIGKYCVFGAIVLALLTLVLPLSFFNLKAASISGGKTTYSFTAMHALRGADGMKEAMIEQVPELASVPPEVMSAQDEDLDNMKFLALAPFAPMAFFVLFALLGLKRFGRGLGVASLIFGLLGVGVWALLIAAASEGKGQASMDTMGFNLLGLAYLVGMVGGIMGIAKPEPKKA